MQDETLEKVKTILLDKFKDMQIYCLNPSLKDLFQNNVYKLNIEGVLYFVPLWHSELHFNPDIIVKCYPELPDNVAIDEDNNIIVTERISFTFSASMHEPAPQPANNKTKQSNNKFKNLLKFKCKKIFNFTFII